MSEANTRICPVCGKEFVPVRPRCGMLPTYCSHSCRNKKNVRKWQAKVRAEKVAKIKTRKCRLCGKEFMPLFGHPNQQYCTHRCYQTAAQRRHRAANKKASPQGKKCEYCGKLFYPQRNHPRTRYCSCACSTRATAARRAHSAWIHRNTSGKAHAAPPNRTFVTPKPEIAGRSAFDRVLAYLRLPAAERYAARSSLTPAEMRLAERIWQEYHSRAPICYAQ